MLKRCRRRWKGVTDWRTNERRVGWLWNPVLGHLILHSLVRSHRSLIRFLRTARFARALRRTHSFARSLRSSLESGFCLWIERVDFTSFLQIVQWVKNVCFPPLLLLAKGFLRESQSRHSMTWQCLVSCHKLNQDKAEIKCILAASTENCQWSPSTVFESIPWTRSFFGRGT